MSPLRTPGSKIKIVHCELPGPGRYFFPFTYSDNCQCGILLLFFLLSPYIACLLKIKTKGDHSSCQSPDARTQTGWVPGAVWRDTPNVSQSERSHGFGCCSARQRVLPPPAAGSLHKRSAAATSRPLAVVPPEGGDGQPPPHSPFPSAFP